jgi:hypothetical protein
MIAVTKLKEGLNYDMYFIMKQQGGYVETLEIICDTEIGLYGTGW